MIVLGSDEIGIRRLIRRLEEAAPAGTSFSAGGATWDRTERAPDLLRRADLAMYETMLKHRRDPHTRTAWRNRTPRGPGFGTSSQRA